MNLEVINEPGCDGITRSQGENAVRQSVQSYFIASGSLNLRLQLHDRGMNLSPLAIFIPDLGDRRADRTENENQYGP